MMKFGTDTSPLHIPLVVHANHLCLCDVLHTMKHKSNEGKNEIAEDNLDEPP